MDNYFVTVSVKVAADSPEDAGALVENIIAAISEPDFPCFDKEGTCIQDIDLE